jgi:cytidylate kinase
MAIITISRGTFSGGEGLAERVAKKLGYRCLSREILVATSMKYGIPEEKLSEAINGAPRMIEHLYSARKRYLACVRAALMKEAKGEDLVYHGHAGHFLLKDAPNVLRIRVIANMEFRIKSAMERNSLNEEQAIAYIKRVDEERARWTRFLYHIDWHDPSLYDVVINIDNINLDTASEMLISTANLKQYQSTPQSRKIIDDLALSCHLEAIIANTRNISGGDKVEVEVDEGIVTLRGTVGSVMDADKVRTIVSNTPAIKEVRSNMCVRLSGVIARSII